MILDDDRKVKVHDNESENNTNLISKNKINRNSKPFNNIMFNGNQKMNDLNSKRGISPNTPFDRSNRGLLQNSVQWYFKYIKKIFIKKKVSRVNIWLNNISYY